MPGKAPAPVGRPDAGGGAKQSADGECERACIVDFPSDWNEARAPGTGLVFRPAGPAVPDETPAVAVGKKPLLPAAGIAELEAGPRRGWYMAVSIGWAAVIWGGMPGTLLAASADIRESLGRPQIRT